jgi:altronate hydrolase
MAAEKILLEKILRIDPKDNVLVALTSLPAGEPITFAGEQYIPPSDIPAKHKFAVRDLAVGDEVIMYGGVVGLIRQPIPRGGLLSTRNVQHDASGFGPKVGEYTWSAPDVAGWSSRTFDGYHRADGQVGTRNYWLVIPLVFCENRNVEALRDAFEEELGYGRPKLYRQQVRQLIAQHHQGPRAAQGDDFSRPERVFPNVDGVRFQYRRAGYIHHPNVAGATVLSLGCQNAQPSILVDALRERDPDLRKPVLMYEQQQSGTEAAMLSDAIQATFEGLIEANRLTRKPAPLSKLTVALKCGGSDGFSGISANPALGHVSDMLAALGAKSILSEFPELCGMEQSLINRCIDPAQGDRFIQLMRDYAARAKAVHSGFEMNPSPGNIKDGLITDAMKSAGAARKGGTSPVTAVLDYPEYDDTPGLALLCTPGNDVECVTAQVGAGANVVIFTTGLGTPTGNPVAPVIKVSTNTSLAERMSDIIDIDTGAVIRGETTIEKVGESILDLVIRVASGKVRTKAEQLDQNDFIPWKRGVSL